LPNNYIESFMATLPEFQRIKITQMLDEQRASGKIKSESEYRRELEKLISQLDTKKSTPMMQVRPQSGQTNSKDYNKTFEEIGIDLTALFMQSDKLDKILSKHQQLNSSIVRNIRQTIKAMNDEVDRYMMLLGNSEGFVQSVFETFRDASNMERDMSFYTDRLNDEVIPNEFVAVIDTVSETLHLPAAHTHDCLISPNGSQLARISILRQPGSGLIGVANKKNDINNAIDNDPETFWGEVILSDGEITIDFSDFGIDHGAFCEFEIVFDSLSVVSEIAISPFTEFPLDIVSIRAYETLDEDSIMHEILKPSETISIEEPYTLQFPAIEVRRIVMVINQRHYRKNTYLIKSSERNNIEMWQRIVDKEKEITLSGDWKTGDGDLVNPTVSQDFLNSVSGWDLYQEKLAEFERLARRNRTNATAAGWIGGILTAGAIIMTGGAITPALTIGAIGAGIGVGQAISSTLISDKTFERDKLIEVSKNEYIYGAYDIAIRGRDYYPVGVYVSAPLEAPGNVSRIVLETNEKHQIIPGASGRCTSIEYYVTNVDSPQASDWYPILPVNETQVWCERLALKQKQAYLRFQAADLSTVKIKRDGKPLTPVDYQVQNVDGKTRVTIHEPIENAIYTADYLPVGSAWELDLTTNEAVTKLRAHEVFETGTNRNGMIELRHFPFIDYTKINQLEKSNPDGYDPNFDYVPISVTLRGSIEWKNGETEETALPLDRAAGGPATKNVTNYTGRIQPALRGYNVEDEQPCFEYRQEGRKLYFSDTFNSHGNVDSTRTEAAIEVDYTYLASTIRLKAIMRRNVQGHESITPILYDYTLKYKTTDMR
jgi:hypothetical protein